MKKILKSLLVLYIILVPLTFVNAATMEETKIEIGLKNYLGKEYKEKIIKNAKSANNIEKIETILKDNSEARLSDSSYPDYIGGLYINNHDEVVIQIVKEKTATLLKSDTESNLYNNILSIDPTSKIEYVNYSYNDISDVIKVLEKYYLENYNTGYIDGYYDDIINNRVVVELKRYSEDEINNFKRNVIDSPLIYFTESRDLIKYDTIYMPGQGILPLGCSIGFRSNSGNTRGFVTAGHCVTGVGQNVALFGTVKKYQYSGNVDAAWIQLNATIYVGSGLAYGPTSSGLSLPVNNTPVSSFVVGQLYGKSGAASNYSYGNITSLNASGNGITGLIKTNVYATNGDSGGIVFKISGTGSNPSAYQTAGIVHGGPKGGGDLLFTKATNIVSSFGLTNNWLLKKYNNSYKNRYKVI